MIKFIIRVLIIALIISLSYECEAQNTNPALIVLPNRNIHLGREDDNYSNNSIVFGKGLGNQYSTANNGVWGVEYWGEGLNFFKAWPTVNSGNYFLYLRDDWGVGIGKRNPSGRLDVEGDICARGVRLTSDKRLKQDVKQVHFDIDKLFEITPISYKSLYLFSDADEITKKYKSGEIDEIHYKTELATIESEKKFAERDTNTRFGLSLKNYKKYILN